MLYVIDCNTGKKYNKTFEELNRMVDGELDEAFFSDIFDNHVLDTSKGKYMVYKEEQK